MPTNNHNNHIFWMVLMVLVAAVSRIVPHYPNFTAIGAMALFGAAHLRQAWMGLAVTLFALYLSDLVINNVVYAGFYDYFPMAD
ncbi:MAG: DUF6580 family putative transport protein [Saprospiraceae bacterium]